MATLTNGYKPYPGYKPSGVEWMGDIPTHWEVRRLKHLATVNDEALSETTDPGAEITYVDIGKVDSIGGITGTEDLVFQDAPSRARRIVRRGDVIISTVRTYLKAIARIQPADANLIVSTGFAVVRPRHLDDRFVAYALSSPYFVDRVVAHSVGVSYPAISEGELTCLDVVFPPLPEQRAIAVFLDRETAKIDALVAKNERLIELLQEKRKALITRTVTKGLDPNAPMKDSGVEWLGEIPAHWEAKRLKYVATLNPKSSEVRKLAPDTAVSFVPMEAVGEYGGLDLSQVRDLSSVADGYTYFSDGDVVVAKITPCFENGKGSLAGELVNGIAFGTTELHVLRCGSELDRQLTFYVTLADAFRKLGEAEMYGAGGQKRIPESFIANLKYPLPPIPEQRAIAAFLDRETAKLDALIAKVREAIARLKELRAALISAAVTGRIDVRETET